MRGDFGGWKLELDGDFGVEGGLRAAGYEGDGQGGCLRHRVAYGESNAGAWVLLDP